MSSAPSTADQETFFDAVLGSSLKPTWRKFLDRYSIEARVAAFSAFFSGLVLLPYLGAVGLWDCWETHYGEVAREMIQRNDYVHPFWENAWFFSKPAFTMWMQALGMNLVGANDGTGKLGLYTEWGFRMPFALCSMGAVCLMAYVLTRLVNARVGLAWSFVCVTMPMYFLEARQAVTDTPVVATMICAMACALMAQFDTKTTKRTGWWYAFYVFCGVATLAKGLFGFGIPGVIWILFGLLCIVPWNANALTKHFEWLMKFGTSAASVAVASGVAVGTIAFLWGQHTGTYFMAGPVPRTNPIGNFLQDQPNALKLAVTWGGIAAWAGFTWAIGRSTREEKTIPVVWNQLFQMKLGTGVLVFLLVAFPWYHEMFHFAGLDHEASDRFWYRFLIHDHFNRLASGVYSTSDGGFEYFIQQGGFGLFPWVLLFPGAMMMISRAKLRGDSTSDKLVVLSTLWLAFAYFLFGGSATKFHHYVFPMLPPIVIMIALFIDRVWEEGFAAHALVLILGVPLYWLISKDLSSNPKNFTDLFVFNYTRAYPDFLTTKMVNGHTVRQWMATFFAVSLVMVGFFVLMRAKANAFLIGVIAVTSWCLWINWSHWVDLSQHWTQRDLFWKYYDNRKPGEPIAVFWMNWRGETFYSRNEVVQINNTGAWQQRFKEFVNQPGRKWMLVEHVTNPRDDRPQVVRDMAAGHAIVEMNDVTFNNKFKLLQID